MLLSPDSTDTCRLVDGIASVDSKPIHPAYGLREDTGVSARSDATVDKKTGQDLCETAPLSASRFGVRSETTIIQQS
jgi:hypothetical protein